MAQMEAADKAKTTSSGQPYIAELMKGLCRGLGPKVPYERIRFYCAALDDLTEAQLEHGFRLAAKHLGEFLPSPEQLRKWCYSYTPEPKPQVAAVGSDCQWCRGEGRLYTVWVFGREREDGALHEIRQLVEAVPYLLGREITLKQGEYPALFRCFCDASARHPKHWPRISKQMLA